MTLTVDDQIESLVDSTTVVWVECSDHRGVVAGEKKDFDRFFTDQGNPKSFTDEIEPHWQRIFAALGSKWDANREIYRLLYDTMRTFFVSFQGLRINKVASHEIRIAATSDQEESKKQKIFQADLATSHLVQMYVSGKKILDLMEKLKIPHDTYTAGKFKETRNKLMEHNHNPRGMTDLIFEPDFWSVMATSSFLPVHIHTSKESEYTAYFDYYQDYYDLEEVIVKAISRHKT